MKRSNASRGGMFQSEPSRGEITSVNIAVCTKPGRSYCTSSIRKQAAA